MLLKLLLLTEIILIALGCNSFLIVCIRSFLLPFYWDSTHSDHNHLQIYKEVLCISSETDYVMFDNARELVY